MRIGWATSFDIQSAAGRHVLEVVLEMRRRGLNVEIICAEPGLAAQLRSWSDEIPIRIFNEASIETWRADFDLLVVTLADQFEAGFGSLEILRSMPAVGVFPDADLGNFATDLMRSGTRRETIGTLRDIDPSARRGEPSFGEDLAWMATLCAGAVVHGKHYLQPLQTHCPGPTAVIPLCFRDPGKPPAKRNDADFTIVTVGHVQANEQIDRVMRAIAQSPLLRSRAVYRLIGAIAQDERNRLLSLARELEIKPPEFHGRLSDERVQEALGEAHVVCCLRYPIVEGGSAALVFSLYSGAPVIVADAGACAEVPDELVWKVSYGEEINDVTRALESIAGDQKAADSRGAAARDWACRTYSVAAHVDKLVPFLEECLAVSPVIDAGRQLGTTLYDIGAALDDPAVGRAGAVLQDLFMVRREGPAR